MFNIVTVCTGNICRSPMAHALLQAELAHAGIEDRVSVRSAGTSDEEHGNAVDPRARAVLQRHHLELPDHRAHRITDDELDHADLILVMTEDHRAQLLRRLGEHRDSRVRLLRSFDPELDPGADGHGDLDIADPWYGGAADFDLAWEQIRAATGPVVAAVRRKLAAS